MATEDAAMQVVLLYRIFPSLALIAASYYFRNKIMDMLLSLQKRLFAWGMNLVTGRMNKGLGNRKRQLFQHLNDLGDQLGRALVVLEIGVGSAANLEYYPRGTKVVCLDPNPYFAKYIKDNFRKAKHVKIQDIITGTAEDIAMATSSVDAVVCTLVFCSVTNPQDCVKEVHRVLKSNGKFLFLEHVGAERGTFIRRCQEWINPVWSSLQITDGCCVNRDTEKHISAAPFSSVEFKHFRFKGWLIPFVLKPCVMGVATK